MTSESLEEAQADEEEALSPAPPPTHDASQISQIVDRIRSANTSWTIPDTPLSVGEKAWMPSLIRASKDTQKPAVLHVHVSAFMPRWVKRRLEQVAASHSVYIALTLEGLYDPEVIQLLSDVDAEVIIYGDGSDTKPAYFLAAIADRSIPVSNELSQEVATRCWDLRSEGSNYDKGRHFEGLLAFLLSRINGFRIYKRNFNAETDEIDIVIRVDSYTTCCWSESGVPFVLVEAKNRSETVGSAMVSVLIRKLETRRGRARIGLLFTTSSFSREARAEELKEAKGNFVVAMLGPKEIIEWITSDDPTEYLDDLVMHAMLR